jgi:hypothetical protein
VEALPAVPQTRMSNEEYTRCQRAVSLQWPMAIRGRGLSEMDWQQAAVEDYLAGMPFNGEEGLRRKYHKSDRTIRAVLQAAGVHKGQWSPSQHKQWAQKIGRPLRGLVHRGAGIVKQSTPVQWAYIAGIFDGEGCLTKEKTVYRVGIAQKDLRLLVWLKETLGVGTVHTHKDGHCSAWRLSQTREVYDFLWHVFPYLIVKRAKALAALDHCATQYGWASCPREEDVCQQEV